MSKAAWLAALVTGGLLAASALEGCGPGPVAKYGAPPIDGGTDAGH